LYLAVMNMGEGFILECKGLESAPDFISGFISFLAVGCLWAVLRSGDTTK